MKRHLMVAAAVLAATVCGCCSRSSEPVEFSVIPQPSEVTLSEGVFKAAGAKVVAVSLDSLSGIYVDEFAQRLSLVCGRRSRVSQVAAVPENASRAIVFSLDSQLQDEEYRLAVTEQDVRVEAGSAAAIHYAIQTIGQMFPAAWFGDRKASCESWVLPCAEIRDCPRFAYRGMHLDVCRHFFSIDQVKDYLDLMAIYKMNTLHWHITEDQGWRIEIKSRPRLTEIGAWRDSTKIGHFWDKTLGYEVERYGGYYTQDEVRELVAYAEHLGITVMPEIDLPGHMVAALASYPELGCTGGPYGVRADWGIADEVLCPGKEATFEFLEDVLGEVIDLFPSEYIHIGGDECPKVFWKDCPDCQRRIRELGLKDGPRFTAEQQLQNYVTSRVQKFVGSRGRKIVGWDEILEGDLEEGATVMSWRGVRGGIEAASRGFDFIMAPSSHLYLDYYQTPYDSTAVGVPLCIGGNLPLARVYSFEPLEGVPQSQWHHLLGVQANLWTEYITCEEHLYYNLLPRQAALVEIQWCSPENKDYDRFMKALRHQGEIYDVLGHNWCRYELTGEDGIPGFKGTLRTEKW